MVRQCYVTLLMSVRKQATKPSTTFAEERRDLHTVSNADGGDGNVMRTVALQLKPEVEEALCQLTLDSDNTHASSNAQYRKLGKLRAMAAEKNREKQEQVAADQSALADAMNLATGVANTRVSESTQYEFSEISDTSQAGRLIRGLGGKPSEYGVMVEKKGGLEPTLHFYPASENDVNPTRNAQYTQLQHDSFVALCKTYNLSSFEKLADAVDGVNTTSE